MYFFMYFTLEYIKMICQFGDLGRFCQCSSKKGETTGQEGCTNPDTGSICSNRGECDCGQCKCEAKYTGKCCQINKKPFCGYQDGKACSGMYSNLADIFSPLLIIIIVTFIINKHIQLRKWNLHSKGWHLPKWCKGRLHLSSDRQERKKKHLLRRSL